LEVILDPKYEQYQQLIRWAEGYFHDEFNPKTVNAKLSRMRWPVRHRYQERKVSAWSTLKRDASIVSSAIAALQSM
jgi:hypothetical protein